MKKYDKEVLQSKLDAEEKELKHLKAIYNKAADDISKKIEISNGKIKVLLANWDNLSDEEKSIYQSQIYQRNFQKSLKSQIDGFLKELNDKQYASITEYMKGCYTNGYLGAMYSIHQQGIPIISPIDQQKVVKAMFTDSKISEELYTKLGEDVSLLKKRIANNLSRGIATASAYKVIARNIAADSNVGFNRAMRIARTEGARISSESAFEASNVAKGKGADVVGQWDAALDGRTRTSHRIVDGEIRELGEEFSNGLKFPCDPAGSAAEVINCRCALLQRAKWALDEDELQTLKDRAAYFGLDKTENFEDFKKKYLKAVENSENGGIISPTNVLTKPIKTSEEHYKYLLDGLELLDAQNGGAYNPVENHTKAVSEIEIIKALAGGDRTKGSCASLGLAYIGQKQGWKVLDFRDGQSRGFFATIFNLHTLSIADGVKTLKAKGASTMTVGKRLLKQCEEGKEYYLCVGRHASIVRKKADGVLQYLELQSANRSGWTDFDGNVGYTLNTRFGCTNTSSSFAADYDFMIDLSESNFNTEEFKSLLGYINTAENEQRKGTNGTIK